MNLYRKVHLVFYKYVINNLVYRPTMSSLGSNVFIGKPLRFTSRFISIGDNVYIWPNSRIEGVDYYEGDYFAPYIRFDDNSTVQQNLHLTCAKNIYIGKNVAIGANVTITDINHPYDDVDVPIEKQPIQFSPVYIGDGSKIYNNAVILPGTKLGKHCVVGANSVAGGTFPDFSVIVGAPARIVKRYCLQSGTWKKTSPSGDFVERN